MDMESAKSDIYSRKEKLASCFFVFKSNKNIFVFFKNVLTLNIYDQDRVSLFLKLFRLDKSRFDIKVLFVNARFFWLVDCTIHTAHKKTQKIFSKLYRPS